MAKHKTNYSMCQVWGVTSVVVVIVLALTLAYVSVGGVRNSEATSLSFDKDLVGQADAYRPDLNPFPHQKSPCLESVDVWYNSQVANTFVSYDVLSDVNCKSPSERAVVCECLHRDKHKEANDEDEKLRRWQLERELYINKIECDIQSLTSKGDLERLAKAQEHMITVHEENLEILAAKQKIVDDLWNVYNNAIHACNP